jgi:hypothetical protein
MVVCANESGLLILLSNSSAATSPNCRGTLSMVVKAGSVSIETSLNPMIADLVKVLHRELRTLGHCRFPHSRVPGGGNVLFRSN